MVLTITRVYLLVTGSSFLCVWFLSGDARAAISYLHRPTCSSPLSKGRGLLAFSWTPFCI